MKKTNHHRNRNISKRNYVKELNEYLIHNNVVRHLAFENGSFPHIWFKLSLKQWHHYAATSIFVSAMTSSKNKVTYRSVLMRDNIRLK